MKAWAVQREEFYGLVQVHGSQGAGQKRLVESNSKSSAVWEIRLWSNSFVIEVKTLNFKLGRVIYVPAIYLM